MIPASFYALLGSVFGRSAEYGPNFHAGQDYPWGRGTAIPIFGNGRVVQKGYTVEAGYYVTILINGKYFIFYHMLYSCKLKIGAEVRLGDIIGYVGTSGNSTGFHLHLAASNNPTPGRGWRVNPVPLVADALSGGEFAGGGDFVVIIEEEKDEEMHFIKHPNASKWFLFWGDYGQAETENKTTADYWAEIVGHASDKTVSAAAITHEKARRLDRYNQFLKDVAAKQSTPTIPGLPTDGSATLAQIQSGLATVLELLKKGATSDFSPILAEVAKLPTAAETAAEVKKVLPASGTFTVNY